MVYCVYCTDLLYFECKIILLFYFLKMKILKVSPKGQVTIPKKFRDLCETGQFALEVQGKTIILRPIEIKVVKDELEDFAALSEKSFDFWNDESDDIYQEFYEK